MGISSMKVLCFLGVCSMLSPGLQGQRGSKGLNLIKKWGQLDYAYGTEAERQAAIGSGEYVPGNGLLIDTDVYYGDTATKIFATVPRFTSGTPASLNLVTELTNNNNPLLQPYPSWEWHRNSELCLPNHLVSVFRTQIDECGRLWVVDTGKVGSDQLCPPQIIAFDPKTDQVIHRYEVPKDQYHDVTLLITPVVDVRDPKHGCTNTFIYVADVTGFGLVVYDVKNNHSWRVGNKLFYPIPEYGTFHIAGDSFDLMDGVLAMALSPHRPGYDRTLYFHSLASNTENYVSTAVIRNRTIFEGGHEASVAREFKVFPHKRRSQAGAEGIDRNGVMFFGGMSEMDLECWNTNTHFNRDNFGIVDNNHEALQFASGVKIVNNKKGKQEVWVVTNRYQKADAGTMDPNEINMRIQASVIDELLINSKCRSGGIHVANVGGGGGGGYGYFNRKPSTNVGNRVGSEPTEGNQDRLIFN